VTLYRCFAWNERARQNEPDGPLWFPRPFQGDGRHDNPDVFGCLYLAEQPVSCVVEQLGRFRGQTLQPSFLLRRGLPLALGALELVDTATLIDLDDPATLRRTQLRPSLVATRRPEITQSHARTLHQRYPATAGLRCWSTYEALWINTTLFDRAAPHLRLTSIRALTIDDGIVAEAVQVLDMQSTARAQ